MLPVKKILKIVLFGALGVLFSLFLLGVILDVTEPAVESTDDMLRFIARHGGNRPEKCQAEFERFGIEGEEALIRVFFNLGGPEPDFSVAKLTPFVERLSKRPVFLERVLDIAQHDYHGGEANPYSWVLARNQSVFLARLRRLDPASEAAWLDAPDGNKRFSREYENFWEARLKANPDETYRLMAALFARHIGDSNLKDRLQALADVLLPEYRRLKRGPGSDEGQGNASMDRDFLRAVLAATGKDRAQGEGENGHLAWVLDRDAAFYVSWLETLATRDPLFEPAWDAYIIHAPGKGMDAFLALLVGMPGTRYSRELRSSSLPAAIINLKLRHDKRLNLEQRRLAVASCLNVHIDFEAWLQETPDDLGLALWPGCEGADFAFDWKGLAKQPVTPTKSGNKALVLSDYGNGPELYSTVMRELLTKETGAESLISYDKRIVISQSETTLFTYSALERVGQTRRTNIRGVRYDLTVRLIDPQSGKVLAQKTFKGGAPPSQADVDPRRTFLDGGKPTEKAHAYVRELLAR